MALVLASFVVMYAVTGLVIIAPNAIPDRFNGSEQETRDVLVPNLVGEADLSNANDPRVEVVAERLASELNLRGRFSSVTRSGASWDFLFSRPRWRELVQWTPGESRVRLTETREGLGAQLSNLHKLSGYHGGPQYRLFALLLDVVSLSMILFAATGAYLWLVRHRKRLIPGAVALCVSTAWTLGVVVHLLLRK